MNSVYAGYYGQGQRSSATSSGPSLVQQQRANMLMRAMGRLQQRNGAAAPNPLLGLMQRTQQIPSSVPPATGFDPKIAPFQPIIGGLPAHWMQHPLQQRMIGRRNILDMQQAGLPNLAPFRPQAAPYIPPQLTQRRGSVGVTPYSTPISAVLDRAMYQTA
jgi:hypothetical protein